MRRMAFWQRLMRLATVALCANLLVPVHAFASDRVSQLVDGMSTEQKVSQMIIPAIRTWDGNDVTDLQDVPALGEALRSRQFGGVILFSNNVSSTEQATRLLHELQVNNQGVAGVSSHIPYLTPIDQEGGSVIRLSQGTRLTGSMAIGATGPNSAVNARTTGDIIGQELSAMGFNTNFAPSVDVNNNPANPVIGVRSFSDDPSLVADLGALYSAGLKQNNVIATYKHFPGHGDTVSDTHYGMASVSKTIEELEQCEFVPFRKAIASGADLIMTAHIAYPLVDDQVMLADGSSGYFPASMSHKMIQEILRDRLGYGGVVVTDALEMGALGEVSLVNGTKGTAEYDANIAQQVINAGVDILLIPHDLNGADAATYYDEYVSRIVSKVESGDISIERINESVSRILDLKEKYGILDTDVAGTNIEERVGTALQVVGSEEHHGIEMQMARQAVTMVKNDGNALPIESAGKNIVILTPWASDCVGLEYSVKQLIAAGVLDSNVFVENLASDAKNEGNTKDSKVTVAYYCDMSSGTPTLGYGDKAKVAVSEADYVLVVTETTSLGTLSASNVLDQAVSQIMTDAHSSGAKVVHLSDNLPYDVARYTEADAALCAYMSSGVGVDPTENDEQGASKAAYNANLIAALQCSFGVFSPQGSLPVNVPRLAQSQDGSIRVGTDLAYGRGYGLLFEGDTSNSNRQVRNESSDGMANEESSTISGDLDPIPLIAVGIVAVATLATAYMLLRNRMRHKPKK